MMDPARAPEPGGPSSVASARVLCPRPLTVPCLGCGQAIPVKPMGRLPERCAACRVPAEPRPHHRPAEAKCVACGRSFALKPVGPISKVCQECKPKVNQRSRCMECLLEGAPSGDVLEDGLCGRHLREVWEIERACGRTPDPTNDGPVINSGAWEWPELGALVDRQLASPGPDCDYEDESLLLAAGWLEAPELPQTTQKTVRIGPRDQDVVSDVYDPNWAD